MNNQIEIDTNTLSSCFLYLISKSIPEGPFPIAIACKLVEGIIWLQAKVVNLSGSKLVKS